MKVGITGASGYIGKKLSNELSEKGFEVYKFVRREPIKENEIYSYNPFKTVNYPLNNDSFRYQTRMQTEIEENKAKKIYKNRYIFF